jgi:hypothetical protein
VGERANGDKACGFQRNGQNQTDALIGLPLLARARWYTKGVSGRRTQRVGHRCARRHGGTRHRKRGGHDAGQPATQRQRRCRQPAHGRQPHAGWRGVIQGEPAAKARGAGESSVGGSKAQPHGVPDVGHTPASASRSSSLSLSLSLSLSHTHTPTPTHPEGRCERRAVWEPGC